MKNIEELHFHYTCRTLAFREQWWKNWHMVKPHRWPLPYSLFSRTPTTLQGFDSRILPLISFWLKGTQCVIILLFSVFFLFFFTEGYIGKLQMWCRLSAFPSGQQAAICLKGKWSVDQVGPSDRCGCRCGEWAHHRLLGEQPGGSLQGRLAVWSVSLLCLILFFFL